MIKKSSKINIESCGINDVYHSNYEIRISVNYD